MDISIEKLGQDLALANYAKRTRGCYVKTAADLSERFGRPLPSSIATTYARM